jgi:hypothetical protein
LGAPLTFLTITESHLFTLQGGYRKVCGAVKRNVAGMDGRWLELTNGWDPTEGSEAQVTGDARDERVLVDTVQPHRVDDLMDTEAVYAELRRQYGDSAREVGGWVNVRGRILHEVQSNRHMESDRRRFFLNEVIAGTTVLVDPIQWDIMAKDDALKPGEQICLGFDGSKYRDATALIASRISDGRLFTLRVWEKPNDREQWRVPTVEVDRTVRDAFAAYDVVFLFADPYRWQDYLDNWSADFPKRVVSYPTNNELRMDLAVERFQTSFGAGEITHDGNEILTRHVKNAVVVKGGRKRARPGDPDDLPTHFLKLAKKGDNLKIDAAVAAVLAHHARGQAIEDGALIIDTNDGWFAFA